MSTWLARRKSRLPRGTEFCIGELLRLLQLFERLRSRLRRARDCSLCRRRPADGELCFGQRDRLGRSAGWIALLFVFLNPGLEQLHGFVEAALVHPYECEKTT